MLDKLLSKKTSKEHKLIMLNKVRMNVPAEMRQLDYWVVHKNKIPYDAKTGQPAKSNDDTTWTDFNTALNMARSDGFDGVGFMFKPPYIGVDLDKTMDLTIPMKLNSYTEYSPSGNGIHVICRGEIPRSIKKPGLEIYDGLRYFTVTGNRISKFPKAIVECTAALSGFFGATEVVSKPQNWLSEALNTIQKGNIHNTTLQVLGKLHRARCSKADMDAMLWPYLKSIGGDRAAFEERLESITRYKNGIVSESPAINAQNVKAFLDHEEAVEWICEGLIPRRALGFVAGLPETMKTWFLMDLALECARGGGRWVDRFSTGPARVLFIDQERFKGETQRRFKALISAKGLTSKELEDQLFIQCGTTIRIDLQQSFDAFKKQMEEIRPDLVLIDSFATFHTKEENNRRDIQMVLEKIKELRNEFGCTFILIHHENKNAFRDGDDDQSEPSIAQMAGNVAIPAAAEFVFTVRRKNVNSSFVYHTKSTTGPKQAPFYILVKDVDEEKTKIIVEAV